MLIHLESYMGAGIIFFYYFKYPIVIGLPILYYGLDYSQNMVMNILWLYSLLLIFKGYINNAYPLSKITFKLYYIPIIYMLLPDTKLLESISGNHIHLSL